MANPINLLRSITEQVHILAEEVERSKWEINPQSIENAIVHAATAEGKANAFVTLLTQNKVDEAAKKALLKTLSKIKKKITFINKTIQCITSGEQGLDPRIEKVLTKVAPEKAPLSPKKIRQYSAGVEQFIELNSVHKGLGLTANSQQEDSNDSVQEDSIQLAQFALAELNSKRLQLLTAAPDFDVSNVSITYLKENCGLYVTPDIETKGKELTLIRFFEKMLDPRWITSSQPHSPHCVQNLISDAYLQACISFQSGDTQEYPPLRFIDESPDESDDELDLPVDAWNAQLTRYEKQNLVSLSLKSKYEDIQELFLLMDASRKKADLKGIGVLITLGDCSKLAMIINNLNSIVVFNPEGDAERHGCPYLVSFGSVDQAAKFLHGKIGAVKQNSELELGDGQLFTLAYRSELQAVVDENQADLDAAEANQAAVGQPEDIVIHDPAQSIWELQQQAINSLQKAIDALSSQNEENFVQALAELSVYSGNQNLLSPVSAQLFKLQGATQKHEISDIPAWGAIAFQSDETPSVQKLRAVQRVQTSFLLFSLKHCLRSPDLESHIPHLFKLMEELKLDTADLPEGHKNLAHCLFGITYHTYLAAWEKKQDMVHPHHYEIFKNDFGRNAYLGDAKAVAAVANEYKLEAIEKVNNLLENVWA